MRNRVVVTGMGVISSAGNDYRSFALSVCQGKKCFSNIVNPASPNLKSRYCGIIREFDEEAIRLRHNLPKLDRFHHLAVAAAAEALS